MRDFIERLRAHPEHIRHRIAIGSAVGITGLVAVIWVAMLTTSGTLALDLSSPTSGNGSSGPTVQNAVSQTQSNFNQLLGAIGALSASSSAPALTIVDSASTTDSGTYSGQDQSADAGANQNATNQTQISF